MIPVNKNRLNIEPTNTNESNKSILQHNINIVLVYSLFLAIALALNTLILNIFTSMTGNKPSILYHFIYLIILITILLIARYFTKIKIGF